MNKYLLLIALTMLIFNISCKKNPIPSENTAPTASFSIDPTSGTIQTVFTFDASGSSDNEDATNVLQVRWDWENDGTYDTNYSTTKTATHQYSTVGTYIVKLEVKDSDGLIHTTTKTVSVTNTAPTASFSIDPTSGTIQTVFTFDASGSSDNEDATNVLQVRWDWENDGTYDTNYSTTKTATHQYSTAGTYTVKLEVKDTGDLTHTYTKTVSVRQLNKDGYWSGNTSQNRDISFNVINAGTQIDRGIEITIYASEYWGSVTVTITGGNILDINDNKFTWSSSNFSVQGTFENATHCVGDFSLSGNTGYPNYLSYSAAGTWTADWKSASKSRTKHIEDPELIEGIEQHIEKIVNNNAIKITLHLYK